MPFFLRRATAKGCKGYAEQSNSLLNRKDGLKQRVADLFECGLSRDWRIAREASRNLVEIGILYFQRYRASPRARRLTMAPDLLDDRLERIMGLAEHEQVGNECILGPH